MNRTRSGEIIVIILSALAGFLWVYFLSDHIAAYFLKNNFKFGLNGNNHLAPFVWYLSPLIGIAVVEGIRAVLGHFKEFGLSSRSSSGRTQFILKLLDRHLIAEGFEAIEKELSKNDDIMDQHGAMYAYATALFTYTGRGTQARKAFDQCLQLQERLVAQGLLDSNSDLIMWTINNRAQLAVSYADFYRCVEKMKSKFPNFYLVTAQHPEVAALEASGVPWSETQMSLALSYANNNQIKRPTTFFSCPACLYSVMLDDAVGSAKSEKELAFLSDIALVFTDNIMELVDAFGKLGNEKDMRLSINYIYNGAAKTLSGFVRSFPSTSAKVGKCIETLEKKRSGERVAFMQNKGENDRQGNLVDNLMDLCSAGLFIDARDGFKKVAEKVKEPIMTLMLTHNHTIFYWTHLGIGDKALELMEHEWQLWESLYFFATHLPAARKMAAQTAENAMLLCPDVDSFIKWRERLRSVAPGTPIISEIGTSFVEEHDNGKPWWMCMAQIAGSMYDRSDPSRDKKRYGNGAATWQIMLANRKRLRLSAEAWQLAATEYGILSMRIVAVNARRLEPQKYDPYQGALPVREALPYIEEYVKKHPGDEVETVVLPDMNKIVSVTQVE
jgi:hypothetical protein